MSNQTPESQSQIEAERFDLPVASEAFGIYLSRIPDAVRSIFAQWYYRDVGVEALESMTLEGERGFCRVYAERFDENSFVLEFVIYGTDQDERKLALYVDDEELTIEQEILKGDVPQLDPKAIQFERQSLPSSSEVLEAVRVMDPRQMTLMYEDEQRRIAREIKLKEARNKPQVEKSATSGEWKSFYEEAREYFTFAPISLKRTFYRWFTRDEDESVSNRMPIIKDNSHFEISAWLQGFDATLEITTTEVLEEETEIRRFVFTLKDDLVNVEQLIMVGEEFVVDEQQVNFPQGTLPTANQLRQAVEIFIDMMEDPSRLMVRDRQVRESESDRGKREF